MGYSQKEIAEIIGHVDSRSTDRYVHVASKIKKQAVERRWEEAMKEEPSGPKPTLDGSGIISLDQFRSGRRKRNAAS